MPCSCVYSKKEIEAFRQRFVSEVWREIYCAFEERKAQGLTQNDIAETLGLGKSTISRRLSCFNNMTLESLSDMARSMNMRPKITLEKHESFAVGNQRRQLIVSDSSRPYSSGQNVIVDRKTSCSPPITELAA